jgi:hypothetical protein
VGLLLGAALGVGAGYAAWGRSGGPLTGGGLTSSAGSSDPAAATPDAAAGSRDAPPSSTPAAASPQVPAGTSPGAPNDPPRDPATPGSGSSGAGTRSKAAGDAQPTAAGNLLVRSTPSGATVFVDDERRGVTPLTLQNVELGTRRVRVQRDGFEPEDRQVNLTRSRPSRSVDVRLTRARPATRPAEAAPASPAARTGSLVIESRPTGATIVFNGRQIGTTPMTIDDLEPGTYTVELQLETFRPIRTTVRVVAGSRARAAASLVSVLEPQ